MTKKELMELIELMENCDDSVEVFLVDSKNNFERLNEVNVVNSYNGLLFVSTSSQ